MNKKNDLMKGKGEWNEEEHPRDELGRFVAISEFRYIEKDPELKKPHPAHLYAKNGKDEVKYHQLTHSDEINKLGIKTIKLNDNPNPKDIRDAYFIPDSKKANVNIFGKIKKSWFLSKENDEILKDYRDQL